MGSPAFFLQQKYEGSEKEGEDMGKGIIYANYGIRAVWRHLLDSPALGHCRLNQDVNKACCFDHAMQIKPSSVVRRMGGKGGCFP